MFVSQADAQGAYPVKMDAFQGQMARVQKMLGSLSADPISLEKYKAFATEILDDDSERSPRQFVYLTCGLCQPLVQGLFDDDSQYEVARKWALAALKLEDIPAVPEIALLQLVFRPRLNSGLETESDFEKQRAQEARHWLHAWDNFRSSIEENWDPKAPWPQVEPTAGYILGGSTEQIKDPVARAKYEKALDEIRRRDKADGDHRALRGYLQSFPEECELHLIRLYSKEPSGLPELTKLLSEYRIDAASTERILKAAAETDPNIRQ